MSSLGIYIHVPFCGKKCGYCDFYSVGYTKTAAENYTSAVLRNIRHYADSKRSVDTVYFGGGTPSLLTAKQISSILNEISAGFSMDADAEITLEANPNTVNPIKLSELHKIGINRLSLGVQSLNDNELKFLGRTHSAQRSEKAVLDAYNAGFRNISCDLMIGIPQQTAETMQLSISRLAELPIQHISAYMLKTESGTPFDCSEIRDMLPDEDASADLYLRMVQQLENYGFMQYEVSNFAKYGFESRHNCRYWKCRDYIGIGPSAHSCCYGKRFAVSRDIAAFIDADVQQTFVTDESPCGFEEYSMLRLRLKEGLDIEQTGSHRADIEKKIPQLIEAGYAEFDGKFLSLTAKGFLMSNSVIEYLIF
jgi:oxygen-independent coproporphyrinogen-3 oxidase